MTERMTGGIAGTTKSDMDAVITKPTTGKGTDPTLRRHLLRLIRQLARGDCAIDAGQGSEVRLTGAEERTYPEAVIAQAC